MNAVEMQIATEFDYHPRQNQFQLWIDAALQSRAEDAEVLVRLVDEAESAELNANYRHKSGPTNILSFPFEPPPGIKTKALGDLVICAPLLAREAAEYNKPIDHHWAHITIHGVLHLLGYDHMDEIQAEEMETLEVEILAKLDIANPYLEESTQ
jgi:probable rRNA maturation factor